ncbi:MAG: hypothetical protein JSU75_00045 [Gammaproteobacteria bacterium]|nr:MAG: hypothetical protein JSU75_00045 [Gammaproteobacteria bacterium]
MADIFTVTAPLLLRLPDTTLCVIAEIFRHPQGLLYFDLYWDRQPGAESIHLLDGEIHGEGPWKAGGCVITLLGCHGSHPEQAAEYAAWQSYVAQRGSEFPSRERIEALAREHGALPET